MSNQDTRNHVFISYAHVDNSVVHGAEYGWVTHLQQALNPLLEGALGARGCKIWFDQSGLRGNHAITPEIEREVGRSITLVSILSPGYMESTWCKRELELFMRHSGGATSGRLFVVDLRGITRDQRSSLGLDDLKTYPFWFTDPKSGRLRVYGYPKPNPGDPSDKEYYARICDLAEDIAKCLQPKSTTVAAQIQSSSQLPSQSASPIALHKPDPTLDGGHVLLAEVTDDLDHSRQQIRRYLEQAKIPVRQLSSHGLTAEEFDHETKRGLEHAALFIQLLSRVPFRAVPGASDGIGVLQHARAGEYNLPILQWREPGNYIDGLENVSHKRLLNLDTVRAESLESFKKAVVEALTVKKRAVPARTSFVFINAEQRDLEFAKRIQKRVDDLADSALPLVSGTAEQMRADVEENLVECDGLLIVYGDGSAAWVRQQLKLYNKFRNKREKDIKLLAVIEAPPDKPELGMHLQGMQVLNFKSGIKDEVLHDLVKNIGTGTTQ